MYLRVNLKMKNPTLCCCFTWIVFIESDFAVAFLSIRKAWDDQFAGKMGGWGILKNGGILIMGSNFEMGGGVGTPLWTVFLYAKLRAIYLYFYKLSYMQAQFWNYDIKRPPNSTIKLATENKSWAHPELNDSFSLSLSWILLILKENGRYCNFVSPLGLGLELGLTLSFMMNHH